MFTLLITILPVIGGVLIAFFRWQASNSSFNKEVADENAKEAEINANSSLSTIADTIKQLRIRAKRKSKQDTKS